MKLTASAGLFNLNGVAGSSDYKASVRLMSAAILPNSPVAAGTGVGKTIESGANSTLTVDGSVAAVGDRIGVKNEADGGGLGAAHNGIYVLTTLGSGSTKWKLTRATDFDSWTELPGAIVNVEIGTANAGTQWVCNVAAGGTFETTIITFIVPANHLAKANNLSDLQSAATARTNLGVAIGSDVQAYDADLTTWAGVTPGAGVAAALAAAANATGGVVTATAPYDAGNATGSVTLDMDDGALQYCVLTGNAEFQVPTGTPVEAESEIEVVVQDGGGFTLDFHADIQRASDSAATFPKTLTDNKSYIFKLRYMGGKWCLVSLVGGFTIA